MGKKLGIGALVALLLFGGGASYIVSARERDAPGEQQVESREPLPVFVPIDPITLPVLRGGRVRKMVAFRVVLELAPGQSDDAVLSRVRRVEDAFITELSSLLALDWPGEEPIDLTVAKARLKSQVEGVIGKDIVSQVLFEHVRTRWL